MKRKTAKIIKFEDISKTQFYKDAVVWAGKSRIVRKQQKLMLRLLSAEATNDDNAPEPA